VPSCWAEQGNLAGRPAGKRVHEEPPPGAEPLRLREEALQDVERQIVRYYYDKADGNKVELAKLLGIAYPNVFRELNDVDLSKKSAGCPLLK
jgi:DNA-binding NtrC family response regulator